MLRVSAFVLLGSSAALQLSAPSSRPVLDRRAACASGAAAAAAAFLPRAAHAAEAKEATLVRQTYESLSALYENKDAFISAVAAGDEKAMQLPPQIPFTTFQKLEAKSDPEFMEAASERWRIRTRTPPLSPTLLPMYERCSLLRRTHSYPCLDSRLCRGVPRGEGSGEACKADQTEGGGKHKGAW
jgi:hypothetical protein